MYFVCSLRSLSQLFHNSRNVFELSYISYKRSLLIDFWLTKPIIFYSHRSFNEKNLCYLFLSMKRVTKTNQINHF